MDIRKIQKTGGASLQVTLPKKWTKKCKLEDKDVIKFSTKGSTLILQPVNIKKAVLKSFIELNNLSKTRLDREVIAHYISGVDEIIINSDKFTPEERSKIRSLCDSLMGFELLGQTSEEIILKNIFDQTKFPLSQNIEKMFLITKSMFEDAYSALRNKDLMLAKDVINRDFEVDKLHIAISRQLYVCVRKDIFSDDIGASELDLIYYKHISTLLERIADHAVKIAKTTHSGDISGTPIMASSSVIANLASLLDESKVMVETLNKDMAHEIFENDTILENQIHNKKTKKHKSSFAWDVLEDSLDRILGYIMNMAEITIDQAILKKMRYANH